MKIRIITSCTGEKQHSPADQLTQSDFHLLHDPVKFQQSEDRLADYRTPAVDLYTGQQHLRLMKGVLHFQENRKKDDIDLWILSAGYGLIPGDQEVVPYECTFTGMKVGQIREWARHLGIPQTARDLFAQPADLVIVLLGDSYLRALELEDEVAFAAPTLFFTGRNSKRHVKGQGQIRIVPISNPEAKRFSCGLVGLKGELSGRILAYLADQDADGLSNLLDPQTDVMALMDGFPVEAKALTTRSSQKKSKQAARANPAVDKVIQIPASWWDKPHRDKLRYFIPDWDDQVDPDYDFLTDAHSGGQGNWTNQVYAHQMYASPNYDGILVSKITAEQSKKKTARIHELGIHRFLRVPREFPVMGDCGAFGYVKEEAPPYKTQEILDYYTRLDFDYGVSIDHLIISPDERQRQFRYELTIHNAEDFLAEHQRLGLQWIPVGAVQGWDPRSYAEAARRYVAMGYRYIALGGLVRTKTKEVLRILDAVNTVVPASVDIHLFGLGRLDAISDFVQRGANSVDSASHLRRAWLGAKDNYWTVSGEVFAAIRIPQAGGSFRAKRIVSEGRADATQVENLEVECLEAVRGLDNCSVSLQETLDKLDEYDQLISPDRKSMRAEYQRTLEAKPWQTCPCNICRQSGVEVIVFRGNNRNRRRGFHNTYAFYDLMQRILADEEVQLKGKAIKPAVYQQSLFSMLEH